MKQKVRAALAVFACGAGVLSLSAAADTVEYQVSVNTTSLVGNMSGPFAAEFQFMFGDGAATNTATVSNFSFGGGSASAPGSAQIYLGNPSGDLSTGFTLTADPAVHPYNDIAQAFTPGSALSFDVTLTENGGVSTPFAFNFFLDDGTGLPISTTDITGSGLLAQISIMPAFSNPKTQAATFSPTDPRYQGLTVSVAPVPLPDSVLLVLCGFGVTAMLLRRRSNVSRESVSVGRLASGIAP